MMRFVSVAIRKYKLYKASLKLFKKFNDWKTNFIGLPEYNYALKKLLIIRLDDIGDYIVFRNFLKEYKLSARWKEYEITFLGNIVWKDLFDIADTACVDKCMWIDKRRYLADKNYRMNTWVELRKQNFETVICPSRTRPLLLDDLCTLASGALNKIGSANTNFHALWNKPSDEIYTQLFHLSNENIHEFEFNKLFTKWCCGRLPDAIQLTFPYTSTKAKPYIVCFISVSTKSRQWPEKNWEQFIRAFKKKYSYKIFITGASEDEAMAENICSATGAENITGKKDLSELVNLFGNALLVISNDTMAVHIAVACNTKTIIISNGNNFYRFTEYAKAGFKNVETLYSKPFKKASRKEKFKALQKYIAVSADIASVKPATLLHTVDLLLKSNSIDHFMSHDKTLPLVSIVLATYNGEMYLKQQLDSLFNQTYANFELIAVDDASADNTLNILNEYKSRHANMQVFSNETNLGFIKNFEKACSLSNGALISPCDQDDVWHPDKIKRMVEAIENFPLIYCDSFICDEQLHQTGKKISDIVTCKNWNNCLQYAVFARIYGHTLLFTRNFYKSIIPFNEVVPHDWWIAYNATLQGGIKFLNEPLVYYRQHASNAFGIVGQKAKKTALSKSEKKKLIKAKAKERVTVFYQQCPEQLQHEKNTLEGLMNSYKKFSLQNDIKRMLLFFKYKDFFLAPKKYSWLHKNLFCLKMFFKIS